GSAAAGLYTRARVAARALLALRGSEALYFIASHDADGRPLRSSCDYRITGRDPPARWWSITLYAHDMFLIENQLGVYSYGGSSGGREADGSSVIRLAQPEQPGNWLPSGNHGRLHVTLRLYHPAASVLEHPDRVALPTLVAERCR